MAPKISIIIPHKRTVLNNQALDLNIRMLMENTINDFELIIDTETPKDPYKIWNEAAKSARGDILVFTNSDVLMAIDWDVQFVDNMVRDAIFTGYLIEPGNVGVAEVNIKEDFGKTPYEFNRWGFEEWVKRYNHPKIIEQRGWYMPCAFLKDWFLWTGGFDTTVGFPNPNDILFWDKCVNQLGAKLYRVRSYAYHFQALSHRT